MATTESRSCRICSNAVTRTHSIALFSRESLASGLADRLSRVVDVPVAADDGQSRFICRTCKKKFLSAESFRTTAKETYQKNNGSLELFLSGTGRKRTKDTSDPGASPHTSQCRPVAKRLTAERPGRRLTYPDSHDCKGNNLIPLNLSMLVQH